MTLPSTPPDGGLTYEKEVKQAFQRLLRAMPGISRDEKQNIRRAFDMANQAHMGVRRKSGEPYILHPLAVAYIVVKEMGLIDPVSVVCALLHDVVEDTDILLDEIRRKFDNHIASIVDGLTKIANPIDVDRVDSEQAENFRKLFLTISSDIRVVLIKLADRLHNMRTLGAMKPEKMLKIASETLYIYAPLAHRFGLYEIKTELEDLAFKYSQPRQYDEIQQKLKEAQMDGKRYIQVFIHTIRQALATTGLKFHILSRYKSIYSIYSKMIRKNLPFEEVYDIYAIRIILETREGREGADCWQVYGVVSGIYRPIPKRLRDWITVPKENHYESLHTTVQGPRGKQVEVQIRTSRMDEIAEKGVAAHWKYKENGEEQEDFITEWIGQLRETLKDPDLNALETLREFREQLQPHDVFVFTPKGEMKRMPIGSTALDFAYHIHSRIGDMAIGAKVNHRVETLDHVLRPGDHVEILTSRKGKPHKDWLRFAQTTRARDMIELALRREKRQVIEKGIEILRRGARALNLDIDDNHPYTRELAAYTNMDSVDTFLYALATGMIKFSTIRSFIEHKKDGKVIDILPAEEEAPGQKTPLRGKTLNPEMLILAQEGDYRTYVLAPCCAPIPGDEILGLRHKANKKRVTVHRKGCNRATALMAQFGDSIMEAAWSGAHPEVEFLIGIKIVGRDRKGMLNDLIRLISMRQSLNIRRVSIESQGARFEGHFDVYVHGVDELNDLLAQLGKVSHVDGSFRYIAGSNPH